MTNPFQGGVSFEFEGEKYTLVFDFNAMAEYEGFTGENALEVVAAYERGTVSAKQIRALFWAMLLENHPDIDIRQAGRMIISASEKMKEALERASGEAEPKTGNAKRRTKSPARR